VIVSNAAAGGSLGDWTHRDAEVSSWSVNGDRQVRQGDVFWIRAEVLRPSVPGPSHPHVVIQPDVFNLARIPTVVVCALTSNLNRAEEPGNVLLDPGEANLPRRSVAIVSQVSTVDKAELGECVGSLSRERVEQILSGMSFQQKSFFER
jgi:mRNA interferase MazF